MKLDGKDDSFIDAAFEAASLIKKSITPQEVNLMLSSSLFDSNGSTSVVKPEDQFDTEKNRKK
jgi:hypothetical protein